MNLIKSTLVALALVTATPSYSRTVGECYTASEVVLEAANLRDSGTPPERVYSLLVQVGMPRSTAETVVIYVYGTHKDKTPEGVQAVFLNLCIGEPT